MLLQVVMVRMAVLVEMVAVSVVIPLTSRERLVSQHVRAKISTDI